MAFEMTGEQLIDAPKDKVWAGLNNPEILKQCIPGCQELEMISDTQLNAIVKLKIGPVSAKFKGSVELSQ